MRRMRSWRGEGMREEVSGRRLVKEGEKKGIKIEVEVRKEGEVRRGRSSNSDRASISIQEVMSLATTCDWTVRPAVHYEAASSWLRPSQKRGNQSTEEDGFTC